jgi:flagellar hook-associated protein 1 FlgK
MQQNADEGIVQAVADINQLATQIAKANSEVARMQNIGGDSSSFEDQRTELVRKLSQLVGVSVVPGSEGLSLTTADGTALAVGDRAFQLDTGFDSRGKVCISSSGHDITAGITGGQIGGLLRARDTELASVTEDLNALASGLATSVNSVHHSGFDLNGDAGEDFFSESAGADAAANIRLLVSDPRKLAASADGTIGDNKNLAALQAVRTATAIRGQSPIDFYSSMVNRLGNDLERAKSEQEAGDLVLTQLSNQRSAVSGVSLDEEATNLIRYQRAYEAAARVVSAVDEMMQTAINLGRN